jgi:hypothetical protein
VLAAIASLKTVEAGKEYEGSHRFAKDRPVELKIIPAGTDEVSDRPISRR